MIKLRNRILDIAIFLISTSYNMSIIKCYAHDCCINPFSLTVFLCFIVHAMHFFKYKVYQKHGTLGKLVVIAIFQHQKRQNF